MQSVSVTRVASASVPPGGVELSERKLAELIDAIEAASSAGEDERRVAARLPAQGTVLLASVDPLVEDPPRPVRMYDISRFGVAVVDDAPMQTGTQFNLLVPREGRRPLEMLCTVRHSRATREGHVIGAQYGASWLSTVATLLNPSATGRVAG
jgi:hypothetical protein